MSDQRILYTEKMTGYGHPALSDTLNRLAMIEHNSNGSHKTGYDVDTYGGLVTAVATATAPCTLVVNSAQAVDDDLTVPATMSLVVNRPGLITVASGKTLTISGDLSAGPYQIFSGTGTVAGLTGYIKAAWFATIQLAIDSTTAGKVVINSSKSFASIVLKNGVSIEGVGEQSVNITHSGTGVGISLGVTGADRPNRSGFHNIIITANANTTKLVEIGQAESCECSNFTLNGVHAVGSVGLAFSPTATHGIYFNKIENFRILAFDKCLHSAQDGTTPNVGQFNGNFIRDFHLLPANILDSVGLDIENGNDNYIQGDIESNTTGGVIYGNGCRLHSQGTVDGVSRNVINLRLECNQTTGTWNDAFRADENSAYNNVTLLRASGQVSNTEIGGTMTILDLETGYGIYQNSRLLQKAPAAAASTPVVYRTTSDKDPLTQWYQYITAQGDHYFGGGTGATLSGFSPHATEKLIKWIGSFYPSSQTLTLAANIACNFNSGDVAYLLINAGTDPTITYGAYNSSGNQAAHGMIIVKNGSGAPRTVTFAAEAGTSQYRVAPAITIADGKARIFRFIRIDAMWFFYSDSADLS